MVFSHRGRREDTVFVLFAKKVHTCDLVYPCYLINFGIRSRIQMQNEKEKQNINTEIDAHTNTNVTKNIATPQHSTPNQDNSATCCLQHTCQFLFVAQFVKCVTIIIFETSLFSFLRTVLSNVVCTIFFLNIVLPDRNIGKVLCHITYAHELKPQVSQFKYILSSASNDYDNFEHIRLA